MTTSSIPQGPQGVAEQAPADGGSSQGFAPGVAQERQQQRGAPLDDYRLKLAKSGDEELVLEGERQIWLSAFANNNPRAPAHWRADAAYDEAVKLHGLV